MFYQDVNVVESEEQAIDFVLPVVTIREIVNVKEKRKWMDYFRKNYTGGQIPLQPIMFGPLCRYFVASIDGKDAGYIRISNHTEYFEKYYKGQVWNASDAYVKKPYRRNSILRQMIEYVMTNCNVKTLRIETKRLDDYGKHSNWLRCCVQ